MGTAAELTGQRFGQLRVIEKTNTKNKFGVRLWRCICDCGNEIFTTTSDLSGTRISCGCAIGGKAVQIGDKFGELTVKAFTGQRTKRYEKIWLCRCACKGSREMTTNELRRGFDLHCGCQSEQELSVFINNQPKSDNDARG